MSTKCWFVFYFINCLKLFKLILDIVTSKYHGENWTAVNVISCSSDHESLWDIVTWHSAVQEFILRTLSLVLPSPKLVALELKNLECTQVEIPCHPSRLSPCLSIKHKSISKHWIFNKYFLIREAFGKCHKHVAELWTDFVFPEVDHPESLLSFRFTQADLHIASENSRQQGRNPNTFLGTSSTHKIPDPCAPFHLY